MGTEAVHHISSPHRSIMDDNFIRLYIEDLLRTIRTQVLIALIKPYTRFALLTPFLLCSESPTAGGVWPILWSLSTDCG